MQRLHPVRALLILAVLSLTACKSPSLGYEIRGREVYYTRMVPGKVIPGVWGFEDAVESLVPGADGKTFQILKEAGDYAKDAKHVFYKGQPIPGAEAATFQSVSGDYTKDRRQVYHMGRAISGADSASFTMLWQGSIAQDKRDWYANGEPVQIRDMAALKRVVNLKTVTYADSKIWAYDRYNYYVGNPSGIKPVPIADRATFQVMANDSDYAKDSQQVYYLDRVVEGADPRTFQALGYRYAKDARQAYYNGYLFKNVDVATLKAVGSDKFDLYNQDHTYAKDAKQVYCGMGVVEGADVSTFVGDESGVRDKNKHYSKGQ